MMKQPPVKNRKPTEATIHVFRYITRGQNLRATIRHFQLRNERRFSSYPPTRARDHALAMTRLEARAKRVVKELDALFIESETLRKEFEKNAAKRRELLERRKTVVSGQITAHRALNQIALERIALGDKNVLLRGDIVSGTVQIDKEIATQ